MARFKVISNANALEMVTNAVLQEARELKQSAVVIDTETTGSTASDEVIEMGLVAASDGLRLIDQMFRPTKPISPQARQIHGIEWRDLQDKPRFADKWAEILPLLDGRKVCGWNVSYDRRMLLATCAKYYLPEPNCTWVCLMDLYRRYKNLSSNCKLEQACEAMKVRRGNHRAVNDALAAARVLYRIAVSVVEDDIVIKMAEPEDEDQDEMAFTVRGFLLGHGAQTGEGIVCWQEKRVVVKADGENVVRGLWIDPWTGIERPLNDALYVQQHAMMFPEKVVQAMQSHPELAAAMAAS